MDNFVGEFRVFAYSRVPTGWLACEGQSLLVTSNTALFSLIGTTYGGAGSGPNATFNLPDLRGRVLLHQGVTPSGNYVLGQKTGAEGVVLTATNVGPHTHTALIANSAGTALAATGSSITNSPQIPGLTNENIMSFVPDPGTTTPAQKTTIRPDTVGVAGASAGHENRMPTFALQICIATAGLYPMRN